MLQFSMIVRCGGSGIIVRISEKDKKEVGRTKKLESQFLDLPETKFELRVCDKVTSGFLNERGFYICYSERNKKYSAKISKERFNELTTPTDPIEGGYFVSRSLFDRIDMTYWED